MGRSFLKYILKGITPASVRGSIQVLFRVIWVIYRSHFLFLRSKCDGQYAFSYKDLKLFIHENLWKLPQIIQVSCFDDLVENQIEDLKIFWPPALKQSELPWLYNEIFYDRTKNPSSYDHPSASIPNHGWVIDAGAFEGFFCHFAFLKGAGQIIAVEPIHELRNALCHSFEKERREDRFSVETAGLGKKPGLTSLDFDRDHPCNAALNYSSKENAVTIITIDEIVDRYNLTTKGFIKMDIEGSEMNALEGAKNTLKELKPNLAIAVYHSYDNARLCKQIIEDICPDYKIEFRGMHAWYDAPPRPHLLFAW